MNQEHPRHGQDGPAMPGIPTVALDVSVARFNRAGSGTYTRRLSSGLAALIGTQLHCVELPGLQDRGGRKTWRTSLETLRHDVWWTQAGVTRAARRVGADLLHIPTLLAPMTSTVPLVVTIHDLTVLRFPGNFPRWFRSWAAITLPRIAKGAAAVITDSTASRDDLLSHWPFLQDRISVIPLGIPPRDDESQAPERVAQIRTQYALDRPFVLTVGSLEPRKNVPRLLQAIQRLRAMPATNDITLVHVGPAGWLNTEIHASVKNLGLANAVRFLGFVPETDLPTIYGIARVTAYPSLFEGFGLPIVEAMASGCPVVTSNVSSMPEVAADAAILVDPTDVDDIADAIGRLWLDDTLYSQYRSAGLARSANFSIENMARATLATYQRVHAGNTLAIRRPASKSRKMPADW